jgi:preprotein translocase subunit SecB
LSFSAQAGFESPGTEAGGILDTDLKVDIQWKEGEQERQRTCLLSIELVDQSGKRFPCTFRISLVGLFEVIPEWPAKSVDVLIQSNAPALLYSAARESLALVTGRSPFGGIILPSVTFVESKKEKPEGEMTSAGHEVSERVEPVDEQKAPS